MSLQNKLFLIDANVLIHAHSLYYPLLRVPEFWEWVLFHASNNSIKIPLEILDEIQGGDKDHHAVWAHERSNKKSLLLDEQLNANNLNKVINEGYAPDLNDVELETIGKDPFLISYALADKKNRIVVSNEISKPSKKRQNRKVPDVCEHFGLECCNVYELLKALDFSTNWKEKISK